MKIVCIFALPFQNKKTWNGIKFFDKIDVAKLVVSIE